MAEVVPHAPIVVAEQAPAETELSTSSSEPRGLATRSDLGMLTERDALHAGTHVDAHKIVQSWAEREREARVSERRRRDAGDEGAHAELKALAPPVRSNALLGISIDAISRTPLEDMRRAQGTDKIREDIYSQLSERCSLQAGLACLDGWMKKYADTRCRSVTDARKLFPNITLTEISFLPLLTRVPDVFLLSSTGFDSRRAKEKQSPEIARDMKSPCYSDTPMQLEMRTDGISYASDISRVDGEGSALSSNTNPDNFEIVEYKPEVAQQLSELVPLVMEAPRLVEILRSRTTNALPVGVGRIQQAALNKARENIDPASPPEQVGSAHADAKPRSIKDDLRSLGGDLSMAYLIEERRITDSLVRSRIVHDGGAPISTHELVGIIGLLEDVPACLLQDKPFRGKILFAGAHLIFASGPDGKIAEVCRLDAESRRSMREAVFSEQTMTSESNRTMLAIQNELTSRIQTALFGELMGSSVSPQQLARQTSPIEEIAVVVYKQHGVSILGLAERQMPGGDTSVGKGISGDPDVETRLKLGLAEMQQVQAVLNRLGPPLLTEIKQVEKVQRELRDFLDMDLFNTCHVSYDPDSSTLRISEAHEAPFSQTRQEARDERAFLMAHAIGMSLWNFAEGHEFWGARHSSSQPNPQREDFVHPIGMRSAKSDFAATFAAYTLCKPDLEGLAKRNPIIDAKMQRMVAYLRSTGADVESMTTKLISLDNATLGLRAVLRDMPDPSDPAAVIDYLRKRAERQSESDYLVEDDDEHTGAPIYVKADYELQQDREQALSCLKSTLQDVFSGSDEGTLAEIAERLFDAVSDGDVHAEIDAVAEEYSELGDQLDEEEDAAEALRDLLQDQGLLSDYE